MEAEEGMANRRIPCPRGPHARRLELDQRHALRAWPAARLRHLGPARQSRLVLSRRSCPTSRSRSTSSAAGDDSRGKGGPLNVADMCDTHELCDAFIDAAAATGYPKNKDYNNGDQEGFGYYQVTMKNGKRQSTARAFLDPIPQPAEPQDRDRCPGEQHHPRGQARGRCRLLRYWARSARRASTARSSCRAVRCSHPACWSIPASASPSCCAATRHRGEARAEGRRRELR